MCLRVRVLYQCGCNATRTIPEHPDQIYELWSCHGYTPSCYGYYEGTTAWWCIYILANDCGRPTCNAVKNYWSWRVHKGLSEQELWWSFVQGHDRWYDAGANNQLSPVVIHHPHERAPHRWDPRYPRYDQPGFRFVTDFHFFANWSRHIRMKNVVDAPPPPWPVFDVPKPDRGNYYEIYPPLNMRILEEDPWSLGVVGLVEEKVSRGPPRLTIGQVHVLFGSLFGRFRRLP